MNKAIALLTILLLVAFMVGCENSSNPIITENQNTNMVQSEGTNMTMRPIEPGDNGTMAKLGPKPPKPPKPNKWRVPGDFATIQEANDSPLVADGDKIEVGKGDFSGALITKGIEIKGKKGKKGKKGEENKTFIIDGPWHGGAGTFQGFRFLAGSDGATLKDLTFLTAGLDIMNGAAVNDVHIHGCTFNNSLQAISNWRGSGWKIDKNKIVDLRAKNGGGIGILVADYAGGIVENNKIEHNKISGTLHVLPSGEHGGYSGSGIVLYADFRYGGTGFEIKNNVVKHNKVSLTSDNPGLVDVVGFELTDTRDDNSLNNVLFDNVITHNDFKHTVNSISLTPSNLIDYNEFSKNKTY